MEEWGVCAHMTFLNPPQPSILSLKSKKCCSNALGCQNCPTEVKGRVIFVSMEQCKVRNNRAQLGSQEAELGGCLEGSEFSFWDNMP